MKKQIWFQTDLGYEATRQKLVQQKTVIGDMQPSKGRLTFYFKDMKDFTVQITTQGKLGIFYPETADYNIILERLKPYLVKADGSQAKILREISISEKKPSEGLFDELAEDLGLTKEQLIELTKLGIIYGERE